MDGGAVTPSQDREGVPISSAQRFLAFCHFAIGCPFLEQAPTPRVTPQPCGGSIPGCGCRPAGVLPFWHYMWVEGQLSNSRQKCTPESNAIYQSNEFDQSANGVQ